MASGLSTVVVLALYVFLGPSVSAGYDDCEGYRDTSNTYHSSKKCSIGFCCGNCFNRYCCQDSFWRLTEDAQDACDTDISSPYYLIVGITGSIILMLIAICCCVCPCCCLYKMCRKPRPVIATSTHTTVVTTTPRNYPQQPMASPGQPQSYQGVQYPPYQPVPVQSGYGSQPVPQGYGPQPMPYPGQPFTPGPPPSYQEASACGPVYPPTPMPYSQAAFNPGQPSYPLQPPAQPLQPNAPPAQPDFLAQPAYNPDFVAPPPKTGY